MHNDIPLAFNVLPKDGNQLYVWVMKSAPSEQIAYYRGHLSRDRQVLPPTRRGMLEFAADIMMAAAEAGFVSALQVRIGELDYLYVSKRTKKQFDAVLMQRSLEAVFHRRFENVKSKDNKSMKEHSKMANEKLMRDAGVLL
jgi:hypothetical protein